MARRYSFKEICEALRTAGQYTDDVLEMKDVVSLDAPGELEHVWSIMHAFTRDDAWRGGLGKLLDSYLKTTAINAPQCVYMRVSSNHRQFYDEQFCTR